MPTFIASKNSARLRLVVLGWVRQVRFDFSQFRDVVKSIDYFWFTVVKLPPNQSK
ncbi:MAG TPA: hypothetical protein ACFYD3_01070 [Candidatus Hypogeohydataceae bacterium YC41]